MSQLMARVLALGGLALVMAFVATESKTSGFGGVVDARAAMLVFVAPVLVLLLFQASPLALARLWRRAREVSRLPTTALSTELERATPSAVGQYGTSHLLKLTESHADSFVRQAGELVGARFKGEELARLLAARSEAEDLDWQSAWSAAGFLAKMSPYFGMLATVIGMIHLLQGLEDFTQISGSMAMALKGTLYGLVSFVLVYAPLQKALGGWRDSILRRNQLVIRWFGRVTEKADGAWVAEELRAQAGASEASARLAPASAEGGA